MKIEHTTYNAARASTSNPTLITTTITAPSTSKSLILKIKKYFKSKSRQLRGSSNTAQPQANNVNEPYVHTQLGKNYQRHSGNTGTGGLRVLREAGSNLPFTSASASASSGRRREKQKGKEISNSSTSTPPLVYPDQDPPNGKGKERKRKIPREARESRTSDRSTGSDSLIDEWVMTQKGIERDFAVKTDEGSDRGSASGTLSGSSRGSLRWDRLLNSTEGTGTETGTPDSSAGSGGPQGAHSLRTRDRVVAGAGVGHAHHKEAPLAHHDVHLPGSQQLAQTQQLRRKENFEFDSGLVGSGGYSAADAGVEASLWDYKAVQDVLACSSGGNVASSSSSTPHMTKSVEVSVVARKNNEEDCEETSMGDLEKMRQAMKNGRLERVVRPEEKAPKYTDVVSKGESESKRKKRKGKGKGKEKESGRTSPVSSRSSGKGGSSGMEKLKGYMGHGVDAVDEYFGRKGGNTAVGGGSATGKRPSPFQNLLYSTSSVGLSEKGKKRESGGTRNSELDDGFWCAGSPEELDPRFIEEKHKRDIETEMQRARRISGERRDPWGSSRMTNELCKLCRKQGASVAGGFCRNCERNFVNTTEWEEPPPKPPAKNNPYQLRPPLASDSQVSLSMKSMLASTPPPGAVKRPKSSGSYRPPVPPKDDGYFPRMEDISPTDTSQVQAQGQDQLRDDEIYISRVEKNRPQIVKPSPVRQESQRLVFDRDVEGQGSGRQERSESSEGGKAESLFRRWSDSYGVHDFDSAKIPAEGMKKNKISAREKEKEIEENRDSNFYTFWSDVLDSDESPVKSKQTQKPR